MCSAIPPPTAISFDRDLQHMPPEHEDENGMTRPGKRAGIEVVKVAGPLVVPAPVALPMRTGFTSYPITRIKESMTNTCHKDLLSGRVVDHVLAGHEWHLDKIPSPLCPLRLPVDQHGFLSVNQVKAKSCLGFVRSGALDGECSL